jgi:hypothetical protein
VKWLADENFDNDILRGVFGLSPGFDIVRAQDVPAIYGKGDPAMLAWATANGRILLTHDLSTMIPAWRIQLELAAVCTPIVLVPDSLPIALVIEEILLLDGCSLKSDWDAGVVYLPL